MMNFHAIFSTVYYIFEKGLKKILVPFSVSTYLCEVKQKQLGWKTKFKDLSTLT